MPLKKKYANVAILQKIILICALVRMISSDSILLYRGCIFVSVNIFTLYSILACFHPANE